ncbi:DUF6302 family protein [Streptomyces rubiginosohelvolus]|uniref:DUF6302 family protein n=1 Tax=Streptomyces rubiginosohelvolus TaxID=67362 RepID=UPI0037BA69C3
MALPQDAYDSVYYETRISDNWLLDKSVDMRTTRMSFLVVPVEGTRRGEGYPASCVCFGLKVCDFLLWASRLPRPARAVVVSPGHLLRGEWGRDHPRSEATALPPPWGASTATAQQP